MSAKRKSLLPPGGENLFQRIKKKRAAAEAAGIKIISLSVGQPQGPAFLPVREAAAKAMMSDKESVFEYQDNDSPGEPGFAKRFVKTLVRKDLASLPEGSVDYVPIPGMKPIFDIVIESCGSWYPDARTVTVATMTKPGYPTPADQCAMIKNIVHYHLPLKQENGFLFSVQDLKDIGLEGGDLLMLNFPHNPTGIVALKPWLAEICAYCEEVGIRIFNDAAYCMLTYNEDATTLTDVAIRFPNLNWAEAFSASKAGNNTGLRVGAIVGSPEFISDIKTIKGNSDSGFVAPIATGIINLFENHYDQVEGVKELYRRRLNLLMEILQGADMRLAVKPEAGFFAFFECPKHAFGQEIASSEQFNYLMIEKTGVVGVHFDPFMRYAVCAADIEAFQDDIREAFKKAEVAY